MGEKKTENGKGDDYLGSCGSGTTGGDGAGTWETRQGGRLFWRHDEEMPTWIRRQSRGETDVQPRRHRRHPPRRAKGSQKAEEEGAAIGREVMGTRSWRVGRMMDDAMDAASVAAPWRRGRKRRRDSAKRRRDKSSNRQREEREEEEEEAPAKRKESSFLPSSRRSRTKRRRKRKKTRNPSEDGTKDGAEDDLR